MSTKDGIERVKKLKGQGWIFAGGNFDHHEEYCDKFCRDWKTMVPDPPRGIHYNECDVNQENPLTTCLCDEIIKRWIYVFHPKTREWDVIGSSCLKFMEKIKMCGARGCENIHNNRRENGVIDNRCTPCRNKKKERLKYERKWLCQTLVVRNGQAVVCKKKKGIKRNGSPWSVCYTCSQSV
jgi:hypothetical protein